MNFDYQAKTENGQIQSGTVSAKNKDDAVALLQKNGLYVLKVEEKSSSVFSSNVSIGEKTSKKDVVLFSRQLSIMFKSGVPIVEALKSLARQTKKKVFKEQITEVVKSVEGGSSLSQAIGVFPKVFTPFYVGMIKSGEVSGRLSETLEYLADHLESDYNFNNKIISAMVYPCFVVFVFFGVLFFMTIFIIPQLGQIFGEMDLPPTTKVILWFSDFLIQWWWVMLFAFISFMIFFINYVKTKEGKLFIEKTVFKIPLLSDFVKKINLVRIAENLSTLITGGLPIVQAIEVTSNIVGSDIYKSIMLEARDGVRKGEVLSCVFLKHPDYFPPLFVEMILVGEKTGKIDSSLKNVVTFYQADIDRSLEGLVKLLEPIMIIMMGGLVGFFIVSMLMPIYQISI